MVLECFSSELKPWEAPFFDITVVFSDANVILVQAETPREFATAKATASVEYEPATALTNRDTECAVSITSLTHSAL